jgi:hypothetical protein
LLKRRSSASAEDRLAHLAAEGAAVGEEDVARELLRDGRSALRPAAAVEPHLDRAREADRIDAGMRAEAAILDRDHRVAHDRRDLAVGKPFAEAGPKRQENGIVGGADADHLAEIVAPDQSP